MKLSKDNPFFTGVIIFGVAVVGVFVYAFIRISSLQKEVTDLSAGLASTTAALNYTNLAFSQNLSGLSQTVAIARKDIENNLEAVKSQVGGVEQNLGTITGTVSTLQKLSTIDPELLKKYSKVFFLNENYTPIHLANIPQELVYSNTRQEHFLAEAEPYLEKMIAAAKAEGVAIFVKSAYRSFAEQANLKTAYTVTYGAGTANAFSADQGYSEHQLGTTADFITSGLDGQLTDAFDETLAYKWLNANAYRFGFTLSYPKGNSYYIYEPWHWRFVGVKLATVVHDRGVHFYDVDQREIDSYLANLFD